jgi:hypothetical protein
LNGFAIVFSAAKVSKNSSSCRVARSQILFYLIRLVRFYIFAKIKQCTIMRLTTLARKIHLTPSKLVAFLEQKNAEIDNGINTRLDKQTIDMVLKHFGLAQSESAEPQEEIIAGNTTVDAEPETAEVPGRQADIDHEEVVVIEMESPLPEQDAPEVDIKETEIAETPKVGTIDDLEEGEAEDIELIKAKKVKLEGIKVVGKIELPEKQKKEVLSDDETDAATGEELKEPKTRQRRKEQKHQEKAAQKAKRSGLTISYEEKLRREEKLKRRELKLKMKKEKARKKAHYVKSVQSKSVAAAPRKKVKKGQDELSGQNQVVSYKNPIMRFWAWLNGKYDKH